MNKKKLSVLAISAVTVLSAVGVGASPLFNKNIFFDATTAASNYELNFKRFSECVYDSSNGGYYQVTNLGTKILTKTNGIYDNKKDNSFIMAIAGKTDTARGGELHNVLNGGSYLSQINGISKITLEFRSLNQELKVALGYRNGVKVNERIVDSKSNTKVVIDLNEEGLKGVRCFYIENLSKDYVYLKSLKIEFDCTTQAPTSTYAYVGMYPQTRITDPTLISTLNGQIKSTTTPQVGIAEGNGWTSLGLPCKPQGTTEGVTMDRHYTWYRDLEYNGTKYRAIRFNRYRPKNTTSDFSNDETPDSSQYIQYANGYRKATVYWFKWEPIKWNIVNTGSKNSLVYTDKILDVTYLYYRWYSGTDGRSFTNPITGATASSYASANNYLLMGDDNIGETNNEYAFYKGGIRNFTNEVFPKVAFGSEYDPAVNFDPATASDSDRESFELKYRTMPLRLAIEVNNSASSTKYSTNTYACNNTYDNMWLLSYKEAVSTLGNGSKAKVFSGTDYAKCLGLQSGWYWTRSPENGNSANMTAVVDNGKTSEAAINQTNIGVVLACHMYI